MGYTVSGRAAGVIKGLEGLLELLNDRAGTYDAVALSSVISIPESLSTRVNEYFQRDMVNPWGGIEAMLTHTISELVGVPVAHAPMLHSPAEAILDVGHVDPRKAAEAISKSFFYSVLKGLWRSPRLVDLTGSAGEMWGGTVTAADIDCLVVPDGCIGLPVVFGARRGIPIIAVRNDSLMKNDLSLLHGARLCRVDSYLEAVGAVAAMRGGISPRSLHRPLRRSTVSVYKRDYPEERRLTPTPPTQKPARHDEQLATPPRNV
jgi:hypothetical protein